DQSWTHAFVILRMPEDAGGSQVIQLWMKTHRDSTWRARRRARQSSPALGAGKRIANEVVAAEAATRKCSRRAILWRPPPRPPIRARVPTPRQARGCIVERAFARNQIDATFADSRPRARDPHLRHLRNLRMKGFIRR
ncbi:MAG TPA: hypothetical protein VHY33_12650, partial [Thermoanaerobaculia bacterium]|nr:hypothetical protein [Thermoanaerobaculia bacterium]